VWSCQELQDLVGRILAAAAVVELFRVPASVLSFCPNPIPLTWRALIDARPFGELSEMHSSSLHGNVLEDQIKSMWYN